MVLLNYIQRVKQFYQDANLGPMIDSLEFSSTLDKSTINPSIVTVTNGWNVYSDIKMVYNCFIFDFKMIALHVTFHSD